MRLRPSPNGVRLFGSTLCSLEQVKQPINRYPTEPPSLCYSVSFTGRIKLGDSEHGDTSLKSPGG